MALLDPRRAEADSQSLKTKDIGVAVQLGTEKTLDAMSKERSGVKVVSGTLRDAINAYEKKQYARLARGEIRNEAKQRQNVTDLRNNCDATWGLDTPLSAMTQERWDEYVSTGKGVKLSTLKAHLDGFRSLIRNHGLKLGAPVIPDFNYLVVPKDQLSRRKETITEEQFEELVKALVAFMGPEDQKNQKYERTMRLGAYKLKTGKGRGINQKLKNKNANSSIDS